jgi:hypothetical protein
MKNAIITYHCQGISSQPVGLYKKSRISVFFAKDLDQSPNSTFPGLSLGHYGCGSQLFNTTPVWEIEASQW